VNHIDDETGDGEGERKPKLPGGMFGYGRLTTRQQALRETFKGAPNRLATAKTVMAKCSMRIFSTAC
jgi:hypothetical protein